MDSSILDDIAAFRGQSRDIRRESLADGSAKLIRAYVEGPRFGVFHVVEGIETQVFDTRFSDEAASAYEKFDGVDRGWNPAFLPRGTEWPHKDKVTFPVYAAGSTVQDCLEGFLDRVGETLDHDSVDDMPPGEKDGFQWGASFVSRESGTGFKAAGMRVPGGVVMTWWS